MNGDRPRPVSVLCTFLIGVACLLPGLAREGTARESPQLDRLVALAGTGRHYRQATQQELVDCETLFARTLHDPHMAGLGEAWARLGFRLLPLADSEPKTWALIETPGQQRGWGFYLICPERLPGLVLQAPHRYADRYTGHVALRLFEDGQFGAAAWNTVPRKIVDVAHTLEHPYAAFTRALLRVHPDVYIVQVHGFAQDKRRTVAGAAADLIVSNGSYAPERFVRRLAVTLQSEFAYGQVQLFPVDVQELGATTNVQAEILRQAGSQRFLHLEMSQPLRLRLVNDPHARQVLLKNLADCVD